MSSENQTLEEVTGKVVLQPEDTDVVVLLCQAAKAFTEAAEAATEAAKAAKEAAKAVHTAALVRELVDKCTPKQVTGADP